MDKTKTTQQQQYGPITRTFDFFTDELNDLQKELNCPDDFIYIFLEVVRNQWSPDSCHSKARQHKKDNPDAY